MKIFQPILVSSMLLLCPYSANALVDIEPNCNINVSGNVRINKGTIDIKTKEGEQIYINASNKVFIDGKALTLTRQQQANVNVYANSIHSAVPLVVDIASDGVDIANDTVTEVLGELFGKDDQLVEETQNLISELNTTLQAHFYDQEGAFVINGSDIETDGWVDSQWESEFEDKAESIVEKAMGQMLLKLGTLFLSGDEKANDTMAKLENFDSDIEAIVEQKAALLEDKTQQLCDVLQQADDAENALQASSVALANLSILYVK